MSSEISKKEFNNFEAEQQIFEKQQQILQSSHPHKRTDQSGIHEIPAEQLKIDEANDNSDDFIEENLDKSNEYKSKGALLFKQKSWAEAVFQYIQAAKYTREKSLRSILYSNVAICYIKMEDFSMAKSYCLKSLKQDSNHRKSRMNLARCFEEQNKIQEAYQQYKKCEQNLQGASPQDVKFVKDKLAYLKPKIDEINESRKKEVFDGLKNIGNSILGYFGMSLDNFKLEQGGNGGYNISFKQ